MNELINKKMNWSTGEWTDVWLKRMNGWIDEGFN